MTEPPGPERTPRWTAPDPSDGWVTDVLGPDFQARTLPLAPDDEGEVVATLVRHRPPAPEPTRPARVVLYLHGWNDYFFQAHLAEYWHAQQVAFYALDLRKYGRSLRPHQTPNYIEDLATYDEEIDAAVALIRAEHGHVARLLVMAHSTGGLVAALWARRHPDAITSLVLNAPWLELAGASFTRSITTPVVATLARSQPRTPMPNIDPGHYARSVLARHGGEWEYDEAWRPHPMFPVRPGWLQAILLGHAQVARGLVLEIPVLMAASTTSILAPRWREEMRSADTVLDVDLLARRAVLLGRHVTVVRIPGGLHDLTLSARPARDRFLTALTRWIGTYGWG
ncbi:alpha/beta hydrolase [Actinotalea sp. M2MS4P-6]|uniref:alpha/beta hydrolase n=1 Tax=Actinotalea sp. M2MS4P-6 TaxID=2983762 RepID=UPI0021E417A8|nr:alpha/beta hydrolase [Actinotalea sp. M2MS4P-6]MCV2394977.1 alpha/beta hydrolase [Actinotalea sp. M2MS4P-6]